jgi:TolB-like protein/class 3 adenylate cyclase/Tfp pilus assembly protein PilF
MLQGERRLAAVMFTDIVGYTALAQANEDRALASLEENRRLLRSIFPRFSGKEIKTIGDAFLVEFPSALDAVRCAVDIQDEMHSRTASLPEGKRVELRVGVHLGDVVHSEGDILGDAVNVASRIEPLAAPGGVCISGQVYDHVRNKTELPLEKLEQKTLKNVKLPIDVYRIVMPWEAGPKKEVELDTRRIAVLPFTNISPDPNDEYIADGMTEELISTMSRISGLRVIARTSVMGYKGGQKKISEVAKELDVGTALEGSVRKAGDRLRITVQLIDCRTSDHLWAESYDRELKDVFAIQSDISKTVAEALKVRLLTGDWERVEKEPTKDAEAHTLYLKGMYCFNERNEAGLKKAVQYFERAVERDPLYALAYVGIADAYNVLEAHGYMSMAEIHSKLEQNLNRALEIDDELSEAHTAFGALLADNWEWSRAEMEFKRAIQLNPSYATAHHWYSLGLANLGRLDESLVEMKKARELDPLSPMILTAMGAVYHDRREYDRAIEAHRKALELDPDFIPAHVNLVGEYIAKSMVRELTAFIPRLKELLDDAYMVKGGWAILYAFLGREDDARRALKEAESIRGEHYVSPTDIAVAHMFLGEMDEAFKWLDIAYEERSSGLAGLKVEPGYDPLRADPRYAALLKKLGLDG